MKQPEKQNFRRRNIRKYGSNRKSKGTFLRVDIGQRTRFWGPEVPRTHLDTISNNFWICSEIEILKEIQAKNVRGGPQKFLRVQKFLNIQKVEQILDCSIIYLASISQKLMKLRPSQKVLSETRFLKVLLGLSK